MSSQWRKFIALAGSFAILGCVGARPAEAQVAPQLAAQALPASTAGEPSGAASVADASGPYRGYPTDYPAAEVQTVPIAQARLATARAVQNQMLSDLHTTVDRLREDFASSAEMVAADRDEKHAYLAYDDARRKVLERLSEDPTYRAMISLVVTLKKTLEEERPAAKPTEQDLERILATATLKLSYASSASAMEAAALAADADVQQTRARLLEVGEKTDELRNSFERSIRRAPEFLTARRNLDDARISHLTAEAFLDGALDARSLALKYAYYLHRFDQYSYSPAAVSAWNPYPYGYGYGR